MHLIEYFSFMNGNYMKYFFYSKIGTDGGAYVHIFILNFSRLFYFFPTQILQSNEFMIIIHQFIFY